MAYFSSQLLGDYQTSVDKVRFHYNEFFKDIAKFAKVTEDNFNKANSVIGTGLRDLVNDRSQESKANASILLELAKALLTTARNTAGILLDTTMLLNRTINAHEAVLYANTSYYEN